MDAYQVILTVAGAFITLFLLWRAYFLRDPVRIIPEGDVIVAPADGTVLYMKSISRGEIPVALKRRTRIPLTEITGIEGQEGASGILVGIFMDPMSVHRNRIPVSGEIAYKNYHPASSNLTMVKATTDILLKRKPFSDYAYYPVNERLTIGIRTDRGTVSVTQIADKWIRKIVSWVDTGDQVLKGQQYGMIRFGSQCDIFIPDNFSARMKVEPGEYVYAGKTVLAELLK